jgi:phosphoribosylanthranilate isomerase
VAQVKICGLRQPEHVAAAVDAGAKFLGFVFFDKSPRAVTPAEAAALVEAVPAGVARVGLFVDPDDALLTQVLASVPLDVIQLHGHETPDRVAEVKALTGLPVMKAIGIRDPEDLAQLTEFGVAADMLLVDARPGDGQVLPGGNGMAFDWHMLVGRRWLRPWMLAGGLHVGNVAEAVRLTGATMVDVSSGVESAAGVKDVARIKAFVEALKGD